MRSGGPLAHFGSRVGNITWLNPIVKCFGQISLRQNSRDGVQELTCGDSCSLLA